MQQSFAPRLAGFLLAASLTTACVAQETANPQNGTGKGGAGGTSAGGSGGSAKGGQSGQAGSGGAAAGSGGGSAAVGTGGAGGGGSPPATGGGSGGAAAGTGGAGGGGAARDAGPETRPMDAMAPSVDADGDPKFSFFVTSLDAMRRLSKSQNGFGGDLRFGETTGLAGADKICQTIASDLGFGAKTWRAYLSVTKGPDGQPVHAIDRIGNGPWYDRRGRLIATNKTGLIGNGNRPMGDAAAVNDLPDETGQGTKRLGDTHDVITGSNTTGQLRTPGTLATTCQDWTSTMGTGPMGFGHAWPAGSGMHWSQVHTGRSCAAGVNLMQNGGGDGSSIGAGGGWGAIYCFAATP